MQLSLHDKQNGQSPLLLDKPVLSTKNMPKQKQSGHNNHRPSDLTIPVNIIKFKEDKKSKQLVDKLVRQLEENKK